MEERIAAIREREAKASRGPWFNDPTLGFISTRGTIIICQTWDKTEDDYENHAANRDFIAHAREDIPWLLARLAACGPREARLREALAAVTKALRRTGPWHQGCGCTFGTRGERDYNPTCCIDRALSLADAALASPSPDEGAGGADAGASGDE